MKIKVELELEITTDYSEIEGCTPSNFIDHIRFILNEHYSGDNASDLNFISLVNKIEVIPELFMDDEDFKKRNQ